MTIRRWFRVFRSLLAVTVILANVAMILLVVITHRGHPNYQAEVRIAGLTAPVTVIRDQYGIPQIYAEAATDIYRAQGYAHAQERFWEMDFRRHITSGRVSEMFGKSQFETDVYLRTLGWRRVAEAEWAASGPAVRMALEAYAAGVNAWLFELGVLDSLSSSQGSPNGAVGLEYAILALQNRDYRIDRWDPVDSLAWLKALAWDLRSNMADEIDRSTLLSKGLSIAQIETLYPPYPFDRHATIVDSPSHSGAAPGRSDSAQGRDALLHAIQPQLDKIAAVTKRIEESLGAQIVGVGSNAWVVSGTRSVTGKPILANDPHLSPSMPGTWMQMGLHCDCGLNVVGFTFSGVPGVVVGHNQHIAWGITNLMADVTDLYLEKVEGDRYWTAAGWQDVSQRKETISVAGGPDQTVTVRSTRHGPLLSDASESVKVLGNGHAVALRWTALDPGRTLEAILALNRAKSWTDFRHASALFDVPGQSLVFADVDGNIGYQSTGQIPLRRSGDGRWPNPGWDPAYDWVGFIPFEQLPNSYNPSNGVIVTANNAIVGGPYPHLITEDWSYGYRSTRIRDLIDGVSTLSLNETQRIQFDNFNTLAAHLMPDLLAVTLSGTPAQAQALLRSWDYQQNVNSAPAAYFNAVWRHLLLRIFDELPEDQRPAGGDRWYEVVRALLRNVASPWWDDRRTPQHEAPSEILEAAMRDASEELVGKLGPDPTLWRWGALHTLTLRNATFGSSGVKPIEWLFNGPAAEVAGGEETVNATAWRPSEGYATDAVPSMRMIVDLSNLDDSRWVNLAGVSGHSFSPHVLDQFELWRTGKTIPMRWNRATVSLEARYYQRILP